MRVFHGSYTIVDVIDLTKGRSNLDFGKGFYVTSIRSQAEFWAARTGRFHKTEGVVSEFEFYENAFEHYDLKVLRFSGYDEQWLDFVVLNRDPQSPIPAHDYDIVEGPVANDDVSNRINDYTIPRHYLIVFIRVSLSPLPLGEGEEVTFVAALQSGLPVFDINNPRAHPSRGLESPQKQGRMVHRSG